MHLRDRKASGGPGVEEPRSDLGPDVERETSTFNPPVPEEPGRYQCKICGQIFTNQGDLNEHMRLLHETTQTPGVSEEGSQPAGVA